MNSLHPCHGAEIHPFFGVTYHTQHTYSPLARACDSLAVSIHDRQEVYDKMKKIEKEVKK